MSVNSACALASFLSAVTELLIQEAAVKYSLNPNETRHIFMHNLCKTAYSAPVCHCTLDVIHSMYTGSTSSCMS